jgi:hypothetical protein
MSCYNPSQYKALASITLLSLCLVCLTYAPCAVHLVSSLLNLLDFDLGLLPFVQAAAGPFDVAFGKVELR